MRKLTLTPIGIIHSPFTDVEGMPLQPAGAEGVSGTVEIESEYTEGLQDLEGFSHIILIYYFHLAAGYSLQIHPFLDSTIHGVFATRAPKRPNPLVISVVRLLKRDGSTLHVLDIDVVDGTPLLDIKPYVPAFDIRTVEKIGWLSEKAHRVDTMRTDGRFR